VARQSSTFAAASGEGYELQMGRWSRRLAGKFLDFAGVVDDGCALDAGCGTGALSVEILRRTRNLSVIAVDISPAYIEHAKTTISDPRLVFETGDLMSLAHAEGGFDQVYSQLVLQFVPDTKRVLQELVRVTKRGGTLAATVWDARGGLTFNRMFLDTAATIDAGAHELRKRNFTRPLTRPGELARAWGKAGLEDSRHGDITIRTEFTSFDDYWAPFDGEDGPIPAYLRTIDPEKRHRIKAAVQEAYLDGEDDGPRSYTATAWVACAFRRKAATDSDPKRPPNPI
jgi:SAM-dependent methyltransferase